MKQLSNISFDLIVVLGPTATGKTRLAVEIANNLNGEIISSDSRQVYKGMDIGTGKDLCEYTKGINKIHYHLIDIIDPMEEYNVANFKMDFHKAFSVIKNRKKFPILCGGTGLYMKAVLLDYNFYQVGPDKILRKEMEGFNLQELKEKLEQLSPGISNKIPIDTKRRVIRAIEIEMNRHKKMIIQNKPKITFKNPIVIGVKYKREEIREQITERLHSRLQNGMIEEVEKLLQYGVTHKRLDSFGLEYRYISQYLKGILTLEEMTNQIKVAIHRFAKKQMTFFRNMEKHGIKIHWVPKGDLNKVLNLIWN